MKAPILLRTEKREPSFRDLGVSRAKKDEKSEYYFHSIIRYIMFCLYSISAHTSLMIHSCWRVALEEKDKVIGS